MARLRNPENGCPWDIRQNFDSIAPYTIEEAYEVVEAIHEGDPERFKEELGDLLLQVVFHARMAEEKGWFDFEAVSAGLYHKMIERHPHVFGTAEVENAEEVRSEWDKIKSEERRKRQGYVEESLLDGIGKGMPAMIRAIKLQKRASSQGFDWPHLRPIFAKLKEELDELLEALGTGEEFSRLSYKEQMALDGEAASQFDHLADEAVQKNNVRVEAELGDVLFTLANLSRRLKMDPEKALTRANHTFESRFRYIEDQLRVKGIALHEADLDTLDALWQQAKEVVEPSH